jgi:DTW domain-containing protein YfiP
MKIILLTHERELQRATNTGSIALEYANGLVERIIWQRVNPDSSLIRLIENNEAVLLYSNKNSSLAETSEQPLTSVSVNIEDYDNIIIIDSTWQEAQKIFNQSLYLKSAPQFTLQVTNRSLYKLRANQPKGGLCTIECIIEVLRLKGQIDKAAELSLEFEKFNN